MPRATVNDVSIHYQQAGHGPDLVMIHGLFGNLAFWYLSVLPALVRDFRVTLYDLRGHGYSDMPRSGYTSSHMAADLKELLDHLGVKQAHLVGHSFGGAVALHFAVLHPIHVLSLTLADARVPSLQPALPPPHAPQWRALGRRLQRAGIDVPPDLPRVAYSLFEDLARLRRRDARRKPRRWSARALTGGGHPGSRVATRWTQLMRTTSAPTDLRDPAGLTVDCIRQVVQPTLAIFGEYSGCLATLRGLQNSLSNCKTIIVPKVGHFHPVLRPRMFVRSVREFLLGLVNEEPDQGLSMVHSRDDRTAGSVSGTWTG